MAQSGHIQSIYKSRKNLLEHLKYQGYNVDDYDDFSINEVYTMYQNKQLDMLVERKEDTASSINKTKSYVKYHLAKTIKHGQIYFKRR